MTAEITYVKSGLFRREHSISGTSIMMTALILAHT